MNNYFFKTIVTAFPLILFLINILIKLMFLTRQDIGLDEPFTIYHAQFGFGTIIEQLKNYNNPPLYELLLHGWMKLFGVSPVAVRTLPLLFASIAPVVLYHFGKRHFSQRIAVVSSLLLSASSLLTYHAQDCRVYSLFVLLGILSMHFFLNLLSEEKRKWKDILCFIFCNILLIYSHYFGILLIFFQALYVLFYYRQWALKFLAYYFVVIVLYLPHLIVLFGRIGISAKKGTWIQPPSGIESLYNMLWSFSNSPVITVTCLLLLAVGFFAWFKNGKKIHEPNVLILLWFLLPFFGLFVISYWVPVYISRYLVFAAPAYYILLAICIETAFKETKWQTIVASGLVIGFVLSTDLNPDKKQNIAATLEVVKQKKDENTLVVVSPFDFLSSFAYHYNRAAFSAVSDNREYHLMDSLLRAENIFVVNSIEDIGYPDLGQYQQVIYLGVGKNHDISDKGQLKSFRLTEEQFLFDRYFFKIFTK